MGLRPLSRPTAFAAVAAALVTVFASSGSPIPLYNLYRTQDGVDDAALAVTTVSYLTVTALSLLFLGRSSDQLGRKRVAVVAVLSSAVGCLLLTQVHGLPLLLAGRAFQGIACGLAASSLGSYAVDTAPRAPRWLGPLVTSSAPTFGIPLGALANGVLVEVGPAPRTLGYDCIAVALVLLAAVLVLAPETVQRSGAPGLSLRPAVQLPAGPRRGMLMLVVGAAFVATWSFSGFYQAFAPSLTADRLGTDNSVVIALVFSSIVVLSPIGGAVSGRLRPVIAVRVGLVVFLLAAGVALVALLLGSIGLFLGASLVAGLAQGAATTGAVRAMLAGAAAGTRAGLLSTVYLVSYAGAALPGLVASAAASAFALPEIAGGYVGLVLIAVMTSVAASLLITRMPRSDPDARV